MFKIDTAISHDSIFRHYWNKGFYSRCLLTSGIFTTVWPQFTNVKDRNGRVRYNIVLVQRPSLVELWASIYYSARRYRAPKTESVIHTLDVWVFSASPDLLQHATVGKTLSLVSLWTNVTKLNSDNDSKIDNLFIYASQCLKHGRLCNIRALVFSGNAN